jgi:hypothetical protein
VTSASYRHSKATIPSADTKAADIAEELKLLPWRQLVPNAQSHERIDPSKRAGARDGA